MSKPLERLTLSIGEAVQVLGISRSSAYAAVHAGTIPSVRIQGRLLVPRAALNALLAGTIRYEPVKETR